MSDMSPMHNVATLGFVIFASLTAGVIAAEEEQSHAQSSVGAFPRAEDPNDYQACGITSLYIGCRMLGVDCSLAAIRNLGDPDADSETSIADLQAAARHIGLGAAPCQLDFDDLRLLKAPVIVHFRPHSRSRGRSHFVVFVGTTIEGVVAVIDAPHPISYMSSASFSKAWTHNALILARDDATALAAVRRCDSFRGEQWVPWLCTSAVLVFTGTIGSLCSLMNHNSATRSSDDTSERTYGGSASN